MLMPIVYAQGYTRITARQEVGNKAVRHPARRIFMRAAHML